MNGWPSASGSCPGEQLLAHAKREVADAWRSLMKREGEIRPLSRRCNTARKRGRYAADAWVADIEAIDAASLARVDVLATWT